MASKKQIDFFSKNYYNKRDMTLKEIINHYRKQEIIKLFNQFDKRIDILKESILHAIEKQNRPFFKHYNQTSSKKITRKEIRLKKKIIELFEKFSENPEMLKKSILDAFEMKKRPNFKLDKKALNVTQKYVLNLEESELSFYNSLKLLETIKPRIIRKFKKFSTTKQELSLECLMSKENLTTGEKETKLALFRSHYEEIYKGSNYKEIYEKMCNIIIQKLVKYTANTSQWKFHSNLKVILNVNDIVLKASSYIPLPKFLECKHALINPQNDDQKCFLWCVAIKDLLLKNPEMKNPGRIGKILKEKIKHYNTKEMSFSCGFKDIDKF